MNFITEISTSRCRWSLRSTFATALRSTNEVAAVKVLIRTGDGSTGSGYATPVTAVSGETLDSVEAAVNRRLGPLLVGWPDADLQGALQRLEAAGPSDPAARAGVDLALHDLACTLRQLSLHDLLGVPRVPVRTDMTVSVGDPDMMAAHALKALDAGFTTLKLKLGSRSGTAGEEVDRVRAVHDAVGSAVHLRVDANQAWDAERTVEILSGIEDLGVLLDFVEQPVPAGDLDGLRWVRERSAVPVVADESVWTDRDVWEVAARSAASGVNLKLMKCGGLGPARRAVVAAEESGLRWMVGCMMESPASVAAAIAVAAGGTGTTIHDLDAGWWLADGGDGLRYSGGQVDLDNGSL